jgi:hypothetical protein
MIRSMFCFKCQMSLMQTISKTTGFCASCRLKLIVSIIPPAQQERYLERIGAYEKYKLEDWRKGISIQW